MTEEQLTPEDIEALRGLGYGYPQPEEKHNPISFLKDILKKKHNIKSANLSETELGPAHLPVRTDLDISLYCKNMGMKGFSHYFLEEGQNTLGTSLSKKGFLDILAVTQRRESAASIGKSFGDVQKKGWFAKRKEAREGGVQ